MRSCIRYILSVAAVAFLAGCSKYEEGPDLSLRSKKTRVANTWKVIYAYDMEEQLDITADYAGESWQLTKDGIFTELENNAVHKSGNWEFINDKEQLKFSVQGDVDIYTILKLKENEMWIIDKDEEIHLVTQ